MGVFTKLAFGALLLAGASGEALACACCSEPGARFEANDKLEGYNRGELARLRFAATDLIDQFQK